MSCFPEWHGWVQRKLHFLFSVNYSPPNTLQRSNPGVPQWPQSYGQLFVELPVSVCFNFYNSFLFKKYDVIPWKKVQEEITPLLYSLLLIFYDNNTVDLISRKMGKILFCEDLSIHFRFKKKNMIIAFTS